MSFLLQIVSTRSSRKLEIGSKVLESSHWPESVTVTVLRLPDELERFVFISSTLIG